MKNGLVSRGALLTTLLLLGWGCGESAVEYGSSVGGGEEVSDEEAYDDWETSYEDEDDWGDADLGVDPFEDYDDMGGEWSEDLGYDDEEPVEPDPMPEDPADMGSEDPMDPVVVPEDPPVDPPIEDPADPPKNIPPGVPNAYVVESVFVTSNIGRDYSTRAQVQAVFDKLHNQIGAQSGPRYIGWQEITEGDPCGLCERELIKTRFPSSQSWKSAIPKGKRPDGQYEVVKVPVTTKGAGDFSSRATYSSAGWAHVSPTRFVTVSFYKDRNISIINTHFIAGAWSCKSEVAKRKQYWQNTWQVLKAEVAKEHDKGRNVIVTGDFNRPRTKNNCNPAWDPTSLHGDARIIGGAGIDYIFAVPAKAYKFVLARNGSNQVKRGEITLGIDGHKAHWVRGSFKPK